MAQTYHRGLMLTPTGHRLVTASGTHAFSTAATSVTLTVRMRRFVAAHISPIQVESGAKTGLVGAWLPYVSATNLTAKGIVPFGKPVVKRQGGGIANLKFCYTFIGY